MGQTAINRRQFLVRGGAAAVAVGLFAQLPAAARAAAAATAESSPALGAAELDVVAGLVNVICTANLVPASSAATLGLQTPAQFAAAYASCDAGTRAAIAAVLSAVDHGPGAQLFGVLTAAGQVDFVTGIFAELELYTASSQDVAVLDALSGSTNALVASLHPGALEAVAVPAQPAVPRPRPEPFTGSTNGRYIFCQTLLCALALVSEPLVGEPETAAAPELSAGTAAALAQWLAHRSAGSPPPRHLVADISTDLAGPIPDQVEHHVYPCVALARALTIWLAAERI